MREAVTSCFQKYFQFSGRARRAEFWKFILFLLLGHIVLIIANSMLFGPELVTETVTSFSTDGEKSIETKQKLLYNGGALGNVFLFATLVPYLAVLWRRMHDVGLSGWLAISPFFLAFGTIFAEVLNQIGWSAMVDALAETGRVNVSGGGSPVIWLGLLIALVSTIAVFVMLVTKSEAKDNKFGPVPYGVVPT